MTTNITSRHPHPPIDEPSAHRGLDLIDAMTPINLLDIAEVLRLFGVPDHYTGKITALAAAREEMLGGAA